VGDQIQIELADILRRRLKDPLPDLLTVTAVEVTADLRRATVFVSALSEDDLAASLRTLVHARGFLRTELGRRLRLRTVPELQFRPDRSIAQGLRIQELLNRLNEPAAGEDEA
jgi:ribosome-binding factor A